MNNINIIDIEASGLGFDSYPIEVAALVNGKRKSWIIKPEPDWLFWSSEAEDMHGISRLQLVNEGMRARQVVAELSEFIEHSDGILYSDAAYWDTDWIETLYIAVNQLRLFHIESIYELLDDKQSLVFNKNKLKLSKSGKYRQHRAKEDVNMIFEAYKLLAS